MLRRARTHERGRADFIQIRVELVPPGSIRTCPLLPVSTRDARTVEEARRRAGRAAPCGRVPCRGGRGLCRTGSTHGQHARRHGAGQ